MNEEHERILISVAITTALLTVAFSIHTFFSDSASENTLLIGWLIKGIAVLISLYFLAFIVLRGKNLKYHKDPDDLKVGSYVVIALYFLFFVTGKKELIKSKSSFNEHIKQKKTKLYTVFYDLGIKHSLAFPQLLLVYSAMLYASPYLDALFNMIGPTPTRAEQVVLVLLLLILWYAVNRLADVIAYYFTEEW